MTLKAKLKRNRTVYTVMTSVSRNGLNRTFAVLLRTNKGIINISGSVSTVLDWKWHGNDSVEVGGGGMHMGHYLVRKLSEKLFNDGAYLKSVSL